MIHTESTEHAFATVAGLEEAVGSVVRGQQPLVRRLLTALFAAIPFATARSGELAGCGHVLLEGVPGVAKTLTATTLAQAIAARFQRIQLTPDLLPADILGTRVYDARTSTFRIEQGPIFTNILLADEINRATPKTQSALLEAMQERQVTLADTTFLLQDPFWVLATQNPVEQEGVYPLPEAQLDRFSFMLRVGYPSAADEAAMLLARRTPQAVQPRIAPEDVIRIRAFIHDTVFVEDRLVDYIVRLGRATRDPAAVGRAALSPLLVLGVSPRSYQHVLALARVTAFLHGRSYVVPADVREIYCDAVRHRVARSLRAQADRVETDEIVGELIAAVPA